MILRIYVHSWALQCYSLKIKLFLKMLVSRICFCNGSGSKPSLNKACFLCRESLGYLEMMDFQEKLDLRYCNMSKHRMQMACFLLCTRISKFCITNKQQIFQHNALLVVTDCHTSGSLRKDYAGLFQALGTYLRLLFSLVLSGILELFDSRTQIYTALLLVV